ncbi:MAG: hypothetical protein LPK07_00230 [Hymenobacteraceae bacterium]|nr:hypothetical protein [Hymenobacteraceae bacterium]
MTHKVERLSVARVTRKRYDTIIARLLSTAAMHKAAFPQLTAIEAFLDSTYTQVGMDEDCLEKLDELCLYFQELSVNSYIFRHLYHNLCTDVDAVKNNTPPYDKGSTYIILPE